MSILKCVSICNMVNIDDLWCAGKCLPVSSLRRVGCGVPSFVVFADFMV